MIVQLSELRSKHIHVLWSPCVRSQSVTFSLLPKGNPTILFNIISVSEFFFLLWYLVYSYLGDILLACLGTNGHNKYCFE